MIKCSKIYDFFLDFLFPKFCVDCQVEGTFLCEDCSKNILPVITQVCPECGRISKNGKYCKNCEKNKKISGILVACYYEEGPIREIIHNFKYNSATELSKILSKLMSETLKENKIKIDLITFVPLHFRRLASRGYNQSEILAKEIGTSCKLQVSKLLVKTKKTKRQVELIGTKRKKNLNKVFKVEKSKVHKVENKNILLIDDISTTGATLNECAAVLKAAGAKKVWGLVVARG